MVRLFMRGRGEGSGTQMRDATRALADMTRRLLALEEEATVSVSEIACGDPACGGAETVVLVMRPGHPTQAAKVLMPVARVTEEDLLAALQPLSQMMRAG
ncbi:hypothetical protein GCM10007301_37320 [Azorhizobium oxalatiphilum]|uniref:Uncharacterized protein n=1 Tax=Azorhizobium oxalatiphilum TaxID=980631 RepID=A0A917C661_9HYPH|nr:hypothetical protein [Azorhizobium oxalatiphilum]GGF74041.1 hypothetical protein GCM10007301_37320 [Azorhizobium oxalatiphilum]